MKSNEKIYNILMSKGFRLIEHDSSEYFGDFYDVFTKGNLELRFSSSKSFETVDLRNRTTENWYDLALIKALMYNEQDLNNVTSLEDNYAFLIKEFIDIRSLFSVSNFATTKKKLDKIRDERAKQMFPEI